MPDKKEKAPRVKRARSKASSSEKKGSTAPRDPPVSARSKKLSKVLSGIEGFQLWADVRRPPICRTRITSFNRGMRTGGLPGGMLGIIHGPSQGGKTLLGAEFLYDVWATGGWGLFVDAECRAVDLKWFSTICGALDEVAYYKPVTYEECIVKVEEFRKKFRTAKEKGDVPKGAFLGITVDSINRLTPGTELEELLKGKVQARGYPLRALLTSKWLDRLIPTLERDEIVVFVQREGQNIDAMPGQKKYKVKGGVAPIYDGGWVCRITSAGHVRVEKGEKKVLVGEKHEVEVLKNSMGPHLEEVGYFYSSIGARDGAPLGLDFAREVREESLTRGLVKYKSGSGYVRDGEKLAANKAEYLRWLQGVNGDGEANWSALATDLNAEFDYDD